MNNKRWIEETLAHHQTDLVPYNFLFTPPARKLVENYYGTDDVATALDLPIRMIGLGTVKPLYASPEEYGETLVDEYGVVWSTTEIDRGSPIGPCLPNADLSTYTFPSASAEYRFDGLDAWCKENREHYRILWVGDLWERATFMRGMQDLLVDLSLHPVFVEELLQGIAWYIIETERILFERYEFEAIAVSDDYGAQKSLLMSPENWRHFIKPRLADIYRIARENERTVFHHSCGNVRPVIGDMIDVGLDILHPIQPEAMDVFELKREFGRDLTFCGGVRTQDLLPTGTPREVRAEVRQLRRYMGAGGGYILEPGITVQADVPLENIIAMIEEARAPV